MANLASGTANKMFPDRLIPMVLELAVYGYLSGLLRKVFLKNIKKNVLSSVLALAISMIAGRIPAAFVSAIFTTTQEKTYFVALWISLLGKFTSTWVGIIMQLVLIPAILLALQKSGVLLKYLPQTTSDLPPQSTADKPDTADQPPIPPDKTV